LGAYFNTFKAALTITHGLRVMAIYTSRIASLKKNNKPVAGTINVGERYDFVYNSFTVSVGFFF
jgi:hypothetical protein